MKKLPKFLVVVGLALIFASQVYLYPTGIALGPTDECQIGIEFSPDPGIFGYADCW